MPTLHGMQLSRAELARRTGVADQMFGVILVELADGPERGVRVLQFRTGSGLAFEVFVDRGMDVGTVSLHGIPLGFRSPTGFRHPALVDPDAEDGLGWLRGFTGIVNTCGLDHIMGPEEESAEHYGYPYRDRVRHGLHGRAAYIPARLAGYGVSWNGENGTLWAEGEVRQATMFGENLLLRRRIEVEVGGSTILQRDTVTNEGFRATPHALLYHVNVAWPVVDDEARLIAPIRKTPFTAHDPRATSIGAVDQAPPQRNFLEQVYEHEIQPDADGLGFAAMVNAGFALPGGATGLGFLVEWDARAMPAFYQWQNLQEGYYVVGLEPGTAHAGSRAERRKRGEIMMLGHGESRSYRLRLTPLAGSDAIAGVERRAAEALG
jgi:hypothetical protein